MREILKVKKSNDYILLFFLVAVTTFCSSQSKPPNMVWPLYIGHGLDFNYNPPQHFYSGIKIYQVFGNNESLTAINSPTTGNLLFYSTGNFAYNAQHEVMPNGSGLLGGNSATQGSLIIPYPADTTRYYLFVLKPTGGTPAGLSYSIIDMSLDNGKGDIVPNAKNIALNNDPLAEKMVGITHANCQDYWLVVHKGNSDCFLSYRITSAGIVLPPVQSCLGKYYDFADPNVYYLGPGEMELSPNGKLLAVAHYDYGHDVYSELFDFDNATGIVSNQRKIWTGFSYGIEFSPDNSKLYVTSEPKHAGEAPPHVSSHSYVYQFDLTNEASINDSRYIVDSSDRDTRTLGMELASDGRIYLASPPLRYIENPNAGGPMCGYSPWAVYNDTLGFDSDTVLAFLNLPNFYMQVGSSEAVNLISDTVICSGGNITLSVGDPFFNIQWNQETLSPEIEIQDSGTYWVKAQSACGFLADTFYVDRCKEDSVDIIDSVVGVVFPNAFTPNMDGSNDFFYPVLKGNTTVISFTVYNRWGELLYSNPYQGWDGNFKNKSQPIGTYIFYSIISEKDSIKGYSGSFSLLR